MVNLGNLYETFLLGDAWLEFEGYPRKIGRVYTENFVQEMPRADAPPGLQGGADWRPRAAGLSARRSLRYSR